MNIYIYIVLIYLSVYISYYLSAPNRMQKTCREQAIIHVTAKAGRENIIVAGRRQIRRLSPSGRALRADGCGWTV